MQPIALRRIQQWTDARVVGILGPDLQASGLSTDSRTISKGDLFVALRGERFDGHDFVSRAVDAGAVAAVVEESWVEEQTGGTPGPLLAVPSCLVALGTIAREYRKNFNVPVIGVTGTAGKTTSKEMIAAVLGQQYQVLRNRGTENNEIGVPQTLLQLDDAHETVVLELAARKAGDIDYLCSIAQPSIGVLLNIGSAHLEHFGSVERVAKAKGELLGYLDESSTALINVDDCVVVKEAKRTKGRLLGFSLRCESEYRGERLVLDQEGCGHFSLQHTNFDLRIPGRHNVYNALAALGVAGVLGVPLAACSEALSTFQSVSMRSDLQPQRNWTLLDDTYNANPDSVRAALDLLCSVSGRRRIAVLGDMLELGPAGLDLHAAIGRHAAAAGVDLVMTTGPLSRRTAAAAAAAGLGDDGAVHYADVDELGRQLRAVLSAGDVVLVKGSRAMQMERIVRLISR